MALAIYGLMIFPHTQGYICVEVANLVEQLDHGANPVPAILAETIRSLNACRRGGAGRFTGCVELFYIWAKSHFPSRQAYFRPINYFEEQRIPIQEFKAGVWDTGKSKEHWISLLHELTSTGVEWKPWWMRHDPVLYRCGEYYWVPMLGIWGGISYAPALVRRQFGSKQFIPVTHGLNELEFGYQDRGAAQMRNDIIKAWKFAHRVGAGDLDDSAFPEYELWHKRRGKGLRVPKVNGPNLPFKVGHDSRDIHTELEYRHGRIYEDTQDENAALLEKVEMLTKERDYWREKSERDSKKMRLMEMHRDKSVEENPRLKDTIRALKGKMLGFEEMIGILQTGLDIHIEERDGAVQKSESLQALVDGLNNKSQEMMHENHQLRVRAQKLEHQIQAQLATIQTGLGEQKRLRGECRVWKDAHGDIWDRTQDLVAEFTRMARRSEDLADMVNNFRQLMVPGDAARCELIDFLDRLHGQLRHVGRFH